jgi:hypothetical protein
MRCHVKQKRFQMHVREQALAGLKNQASGAWSTTSGAPSGVDNNVLHGMLGAEPGVGRPKKGGKVKPHFEHYAAYTGPRGSK